jgi:hypothetical protein
MLRATAHFHARNRHLKAGDANCLHDDLPSIPAIRPLSIVLVWELDLVRWFAARLARAVSMADEAENRAVIRRLVRETGITVDQARFLVSILGNDWPSLVREARLILKQ